MADGSVADGTLAESQAQAAAIWRVREGITESLVRRGEQDTLSTCDSYGCSERASKCDTPKQQAGCSFAACAWVVMYTAACTWIPLQSSCSCI
jgi:hypothetical protein